jgi:hypothetical protein
MIIKCFATIGTVFRNRLELRHDNISKVVSEMVNYSIMQAEGMATL